MILTFLHLRDADRMVAYTVHEPPHSGGDRLDRAEKLVFVKDGFNFAAALFTPFWFLFSRMWLVLAIYLAGIIGVSAVVSALGVPEAWLILMQVAVNVMIGFEADSLKRWTLERNGWAFVGTVTGRNSAECERRFFEDWLPRQDVLRVGGHETVTAPMSLIGEDGRQTPPPASKVRASLFGWLPGAKQADA